MDIRYDDIKAVFKAAYHNKLFDGPIAGSGIAKRKIPRFMSRAHIHAFFEENPYVMTRVGEYIHFYVVSMTLDPKFEDVGFRIKESDLFDGEVEEIAWGMDYIYMKLYSREYKKMVARYLAAYIFLVCHTLTVT